MLNRRDILVRAAAAAASAPAFSWAAEAAKAPAQKFKLGICPGRSIAEREIDAKIMAARVASSEPKTAEERQLLLDAQAGGASVPVNQLTPEQRAERFWLRIDEARSNGFRRVETDDTFTRIGPYYASKIPEFKENLAKRGATVAGWTWFVQITDPTKIKQITDDCMQSARVLGASGGEYVGILVSAGRDIGYATEDDYRKVDIKALAKTMNEIGARTFNEHGVKLAYHPLMEEFNVGVPPKLAHEFNPKFVEVTMDLGHLGSSNLGASKEASLAACRELYDHTRVVHIKDCKRPGRHGNVELGKGDVDLKGIVDFYRGRGYSGIMLTEGGGATAHCKDFVVDTLGLSVA
jgi:sugar phosphate isomerase/epimerase